MKKLIIIGALIFALCVGLTGCVYNWHYGLFNLCTWSSSNAAFNNTIASLDTPQKIYSYMRPPNWTYTMHDTGVSPYQAWSQRWGDCKEFTIFATYAALQHGYNTWQIRMTFRKSDGKVYGHVIPVIKVGSSYVYMDIYQYHDDDLLGEGGNKFYTFQSVVDHCERTHFGNVTEWKAFDKCFNIVATQEGSRLDKYCLARENPSQFATVMVSEAINRNSQYGTLGTIINKNGRALYSGTIKQVRIWANTTLYNCEIATFYNVSGNNFTTRTYQSIGTVTAGAVREITVNLNVQAGDYIGIHCTGGKIDVNTTGGDGAWWTSPPDDSIPCVNKAFNYVSGWVISLEGIVITPQ